MKIRAGPRPGPPRDAAARHPHRRHPLFFRLALAPDEIEPWRHDLFAHHEPIEMAVKKVQIDGLESFEIGSTLIVSGRVHTVHVVVVQ